MSNSLSRFTNQNSPFRDKLLPGQEEEWRIKISGPKKEKVAAEMVAALYDASLDQFARNSYSLNPFPSTGYNSFPFRGNSFGEIGRAHV